MVLSRFFFVRRYTWKHVGGVILCTFGVTLSLLTDRGTDQDQAVQEGVASKVSLKVFGNGLVLLSTCFYALLDVLCECIGLQVFAQKSGSAMFEHICNTADPSCQYRHTTRLGFQ